MAWHPGHKLSYIPVIDVPSMVSDYEDGDFSDTLEVVAVVDGEPFSPGKLVAFDPLAGKARWTVEHELPFNGGVMTTAGNLVFQGDAKGRFTAYAADTGDVEWSVTTGSSISAAPATYSIDSEQFIVIPIGSGGGLQFVYPEMHSTKESRGPTRLLAFSLEGDKALPIASVTARELPDQPKLDATMETIEMGKQYYHWECSGCHGKSGVVRFGGSVPDLRYASKETHAGWHAIVIGGSKRGNGMPAIEISAEESEAVRAYVLSRAMDIRQSGDEKSRD